MRIQICRRCGHGVVGRARCLNCEVCAKPAQSIKTVLSAFLVTSGFLMLGIQEAPESTVLGQIAPTGATLRVYDDPFQVDIDSFDSAAGQLAFFDVEQ